MLQHIKYFHKRISEKKVSEFGFKYNLLQFMPEGIGMQKIISLLSYSQMTFLN